MHLNILPKRERERVNWFSIKSEHDRTTKKIPPPPKKKRVCMDQMGDHTY